MRSIRQEQKKELWNDSTLAYYDRNAERYFRDTVGIDTTSLYKRFLRYVPAGGRVLDAGSGSGRDTLAFSSRGYQVEAFDASPELAALSMDHTGITTKVMRFQDLTEVDRYDGIWACASLLHVPATELPLILSHLGRALKPGGALYLSFKHGSGERKAQDGRLFTDMNESQLTHFFSQIPDLVLKEMWITEGEDCFQGLSRWLNAIALKLSD